MESPPPEPTPPALITPAPAPTLMPLPYVINPAPPAIGQPGITQIALSERVVHSGDRYLVIVLTTLDVTSVTAEAYGLRFTLFPVGAGRFGVTGEAPSIPFFVADRTIAVRLTARTADGRTATQSVDLQLAR